VKKFQKYLVYILASQRNVTLYIGVTNGVFRRCLEHKFKKHEDSFADRYNVNKLVYFESYQYIHDAIRREKELKAGTGSGN
jgi:putative endonuclease